MSDLADCILIVEDEFLIAEGLRYQVEEMGQVVCAITATADEAIAAAQAYRPRVVLMDMRLRGEKDGVDAALAIYATVGSKVIFITGSREPATMERIHTDHPAAVLFKPLSDRQLRNTIEEVLAG
ncbi:response regulator [soil metagenome]